MSVNVKCFCLAAALLLLVPSTAIAHKLRVFAWGEGDRIQVETAFAGGKPAKGAEAVLTEEASGHTLDTTTTADDGTCSFAITDTLRQRRFNLLVEVNAGEGHRGEWRIIPEDYLGGEPAPAAVSSDASAQDEEAIKASLGPKVEPPSRTPLSKAELEALQGEGIASLKAQLRTEIAEDVATIVAREVAPVKRHLAELSDPAPSVTEIIGGIGWLVGLAGMALYFRSRRDD